MRSLPSLSIGRRGCGVAAALLTLSTAHAEAPKADWPLWTASPATLPAFDFDAARPGLELPTIASSCTVSAADATGMVSVTRQLKVKIYATDGTTVVMAPTTSNTVRTGKFPDPRWARYQCNGANVTNYRAGFGGGDADDLNQGYGVPVGSAGFNNACAPHTFEAAAALCDEMPLSTFGLGVAKVAGERIVLLAQAVSLEYHNNLSADDVSGSGYSVTAYALAGAQLWSRSFPAVSTDGYRYIGNLARVGDFLDSDGSDEIRLVSEGEGGLRYLYINPRTGANIRSVTPVPPTLP